MDILENKYIIPVCVGTDKNTVSLAKKLYKETGIKAHFFAERLSFSQKLSYAYHKIAPFKEEWIKEELLAFAGRFEEYYCPVLIICNDISESTFSKFDSEISSKYLVINAEELFQDARKDEQIEN